MNTIASPVRKYMVILRVSSSLALSLLPTLYAQGLQGSLEGVPILESVSDLRALPI
jgi:hypothetical protein